MALFRSDTIQNFIARVRYLVVKQLKFLGEITRLTERNRKWIAAASLFVILLYTIGNLVFISGSVTLPWLVFTAALVIIMPLIFGGLIKLGLGIARWIFPQTGWLVLSAGALIFFYFSVPFKGQLVLLFYLLFTFVFIAGALSNITKKSWISFSRTKKLINIFFLSIGGCNLFLAIFFFSSPGQKQHVTKDVNLQATHLPAVLELDDPTLPGNFEYREITYGSGQDRHRVDFGNGTQIISTAVDATSFVDGWNKIPGRLRSVYWGFGPDSLPLNGRVWLPEGAGPFPVILFVHGNHFDRDFSDAGYAYLGRHLASHGYMAVSVDQNFLNSGLTNFNHALEEENDARGWLLLKHLELLREWNNDSVSEFYGKADTDHVVLVGHSRGGEAVNIAAGFNRLRYYPDDAQEQFDFNFGIRGIVAIAQVDGQYLPSNRPLPVSDINFLAIQGSMDADLESYSGLQQYNRVIFTDSAYHFKTGIYVNNANHGQFNSSWGKNDMGYPGGLLLNRQQLLAPEAQERIAMCYITAFVKVSVDNEMGYIKLFRDYRTGRDWLPKTKYINQFQDNRTRLVASFEEDIDLRTTTSGDAEISFRELAHIYEEEPHLRKGSSGTKMLFVGWNNAYDSIPGIYKLTFEPPVDPDKSGIVSFRFDIAILNEEPRERPRENSGTTGIVPNEDGGINRPGSKESMESGDDHVVDFSIRFRDIAGETATVTMTDYFRLDIPEPSKLYKLNIFEIYSEPEIIPQHVEIEFENICSRNALFNRNAIESVTFIFDQGEKGMIALDNIGFRTKLMKPNHKKPNL
ncbi:MAG: hypothetical protein WD578_09150 [Bacteroidales bacterium]